MKKFILFIVLVLSVSIVAVAQNPAPVVDSVKTSISVIPDTAAVTFTKVYNDVKSGITALASALKVGAEHVYTVLIKQQIVTSIVYTIVIIFGLLMLIPFFKNLPKSKWSGNFSWNEAEDRYNKNATLTLIYGISAIILLLTGFLNLHIIVTGFINPEYGAIKEILSFIR